MAPIQTKSMSDLTNNQNHGIEPAFQAELQHEAEAALARMDKSGQIESSTYPDSHRRVVTTETANGEPISPRDLFSSDRAYELAEEAERERQQKEQALSLRNLGHRISAFRDNF